MLLFFLTIAHAAPQTWCTDLGPLVADVDEGRVEGVVGGHWQATGTVDRVVVQTMGTVLYTGPLAALNPTAPARPAASDAQASAIDALVAADRVVLGCGAGGARAVRVGAWRNPVELAAGRRATLSTPWGVRVRSDAGTGTAYGVWPMDHALARALRTELAAAYPGHRVGVDWQAGLGLVTVSSDPDQAVPDTVPADGEPLGLVPWLGLGIPEDPPETAWPVLGPGAEAAAEVTEWRIAAGLPPLRWSDALALAALQHATYLARDDTPNRGHRQDAAHPTFRGEGPTDRGGAVELVLSTVPWSDPADAVVHWLAAPYHRLPLLHPEADAIGVAHVGGIWVAEVAMPEAITTRPAAWPPNGHEVPELSFTGREDPDPLPLFRFPRRVWPVGFPITIWTAHKIVGSALTLDDEAVPHWRIREPLGGRNEARHLVPQAPLRPGATYAWSVELEDAEGQRSTRDGHFRTAEESGRQAAALPPSARGIVERANEVRTAPLVATTRARALARLISARSRAMKEGLDPAHVRQLNAPVRPDLPAPTVLCTRPHEAFALDEALLDETLVEVGADDAAVSATWRTDPTTGTTTVSLQGPRTCLYLFSSLPAP